MTSGAIEIGTTCAPFDDGLVPRAKTIFEEAEGIVNGERAAMYGPPEDNFARIAGFWSQYLETEITTRNVAMMMVLLKVARDMNTSQRDTVVDIAGYVRCIELGRME